MTNSGIGHGRIGRSVFMAAAGALVLGGLTAGMIGSHGVAHAQTPSATAAAGSSSAPPPPPPPPPPPSNRPSATATRVPTAPPPPASPVTTPARTATVAAPTGQGAAQHAAQAPKGAAQKPVEKPAVQKPAAPAAQKPYAPAAQAAAPAARAAAPAQVALPNTGTGGVSDSSSPLLPIALGGSVMVLALGGTFALRTRKQEE